jgi:hypothetical protein
MTGSSPRPKSRRRSRHNRRSLPSQRHSLCTLQRRSLCNLQRGSLCNLQRRSLESRHRLCIPHRRVRSRSLPGTQLVPLD